MTAENSPAAGAMRPGADAASGLRQGAERLAAWFAAGGRALPWRSPASKADPIGPLAESGTAPRRDPYRVWISEIMLQQTQVATVVPYFNRWMERFPDIAALAAASEAEVLEAWAGLGYYGRARNIRATAVELAGRGGRFPDTREGLLALKGVGEYTAGAIASLAFDRPEPILDGNLVRVFSRLYGWDFLPDGRDGKAAYWGMAREWAAAHRPGLVNEALMELGALVCVPREPRCGECPLAEDCRARAAGRQGELPPPKRRPDGVAVTGYAVAAFRNGVGGRDVLLYTPGPNERLAGLLTFPVFDAGNLPALRAAWKRELPGLAEAVLKPRPGVVTHGITRHRYRLRLAEAWIQAPAGACDLPDGYGWAREAELGRLLVSSLPRKVWLACGAGGTPGVSGDSDASGGIVPAGR